MTRTKIIEGVPWRRFRVRYRLANGRRRSMTRWSPGFPWIREEVVRELVDTGVIDQVKPGSCTIREVA